MYFKLQTSLFIFLFCIVISRSGYSQEKNIPVDSSLTIADSLYTENIYSDSLYADSIIVDTLAVDSIVAPKRRKSKDAIQSPVNYTAKDSIILVRDEKKVYLFKM